MLTKEREELLMNYFSANEERTKKLFQLDTEDALSIINADGNDFTAEELEEFGGKLASMMEQQKSGELTEDNLDNVSGGYLATAWRIIKVGAPVAYNTGYKIGTWLCKKYNW